jgi:hypothetical protein
MKVTSTNNGSQQEPVTVKADAKRTAHDQTARAGRAGRDFASLLREPSASGDEAEGREPGGAVPGDETSPAPHATAVNDRRRGDADDEERHDFVLDPRGKVAGPEPHLEVAEARPVLHGTDLERIVLAVHTQLVGGGRREVTLELSRSVLAGLRVRLRADAGGRISAEFVVGDEEVRTLLERRSQELTDLLGSRGIDLSTLKITADAGGGGHDREGRGDSSALPDSEGAGAGTLSRGPVAPSEETRARVGERLERAAPTTKYRA